MKNVSPVSPDFSAGTNEKCGYGRCHGNDHSAGRRVLYGDKSYDLHVQPSSSVTLEGELQVRG